jgi:hypothetical protein
VASLKAIKTITASETKSFQLAVAFQNVAWLFTNLQALLKESVPSYDLLSELPLGHKSHNNFLPELLLTMTLTNTSSITRTGQTEHIKDKTEAITVTEVFGEVSEAAVTLEAVTVSGEVQAAADMIHRHVRKSATFVISQAAGQQSTLLKNARRHTRGFVDKRRTQQSKMLPPSSTVASLPSTKD